MRPLALLAVLAAGCGPGAFAHSFQEREEPELSRVLADLSQAPAREESAVVVAITAEGALIGWDLREGRRLFEVEAEITATPIVAGRYVVAMESGGLVVRRLEDGARAFGIGDRELRLVGADGEGDSLVISMARGEGQSPLGVVLGAHGGAAQWMEELPLPVATPALVGGVAVVPWAHQRVSFLDASDGHERLRLRLEDAVVGHALRHQQRVLLGQHELFELDEALAQRGARGDDFVRPAGRPLPGQPPLMSDGYEPRVAPDGARNRVRLAWALDEEPDEELALSDGTVYFLFYRLLFALDASADEVRWVHTLASDAVGVSAGPGGVMVATEDGHARWIAAADGREVWSADLGSPLRAAELRLSGFVPEGGAPEGTPEPLRAQLERAAGLQDARLDGGRALAIRFLARSSDEDVTQQLIALCAPRAVTRSGARDGRPPPAEARSAGAGDGVPSRSVATDVNSPARRAACDALAARTHGGAFVRTALRGRASFLDDTPPPPVGALARAAATMRLRNLVPELLRHLDDPATPVDELPGLFEGLGGLGVASAARSIEGFLRLYHADATDGREADALAAAARALLALAPDRFALVQELAADPIAPESVRQRLSSALTEHQAASAPPAAAPPAPPPRRAAPPPVADDRPERITDEMRREVLRPVEARLRRCLEPRGADPFPSARVSMFVDGEGRPQTISVMPAALQECVEPLIRGRAFPRTRRGSEALVHVIRR